MNGSEKKAKRHLEREGLDAERRVKDKKPSHKRQKMNKKNLQRRPASTSSSPRSDFSQSDDSDEEMAVCPAERCQLPEGDEVRKKLFSAEVSLPSTLGSDYMNTMYISIMKQNEFSITERLNFSEHPENDAGDKGGGGLHDRRFERQDIKARRQKPDWSEPISMYIWAC